MEKMETYAAAGTLGLVMSLMTVWVGWYVLTLVARWRIFDKAGIAGWKSLIPIYSDYCTYKIAWRTSFFWAMLVLGGVAGFIANRMGVYTDAGETVPALLTALNSACSLAVAVINLLMNVNLSKKFGHGVLYGLGLTFLTPVFTMILGLGASEYQGNPEEGLPSRRVYYI